MRTRTRFALVAGIAALAAAVPLSVAAAASSDDSPGSYTFAMYGDAPYGTNPTDTAEFQATPAFIASVNAASDVNFVGHVGDIHSGKQFCTEAYDRSIAGLWQAYTKPLVYTPGDNEWTDCHKAGEGGGTYDPATGQIKHVLDPTTGQPVDYAGGDPAANLALVRQIFFPQPGATLGSGSLHVDSQATDFDPAHPSDAQFVENVMWERKGMLFVTVDLPGGSNNDADVWYGAPTASAAQTQEAADRTGADLRWLDRAFGQAQADDVRAVVVMLQADMWDLDGNTTAHLSNYEPIVASLANHTAAFGKSVLLFNGDSHVYRSDNPLVPDAPCTTEAPGGGEQSCSSVYFAHPFYNVPNFHRIVVHGSTFPLEWLKVTYSPPGHTPSGPNTFGPFSWVRMPQPQS
ncbi:MAG TPA: hypothetical protein VKB69_03560 [Micromonosporaceae bacterium]|nr:hypothetical protein [Micromonosporaceae bacterium]